MVFLGSKPGRQDGRRRQLHWAMAAPLNCALLEPSLRSLQWVLVPSADRLSTSYLMTKWLKVDRAIISLNFNTFVTNKDHISLSLSLSTLRVSRLLVCTYSLSLSVCFCFCWVAPISNLLFVFHFAISANPVLFLFIFVLFKHLTSVGFKLGS